MEGTVQEDGDKGRRFFWKKVQVVLWGYLWNFVVSVGEKPGLSWWTKKTKSDRALGLLPKHWWPGRDTEAAWAEDLECGKRLAAAGKTLGKNTCRRLKSGNDNAQRLDMRTPMGGELGWPRGSGPAAWGHCVVWWQKLCQKVYHKMGPDRGLSGLTISSDWFRRWRCGTCVHNEEQAAGVVKKDRGIYLEASLVQWGTQTRETGNKGAEVLCFDEGLWRE